MAKEPRGYTRKDALKAYDEWRQTALDYEERYPAGRSFKMIGAIYTESLLDEAEVNKAKDRYLFIVGKLSKQQGIVTNGLEGGDETASQAGWPSQ